MLIDFNQLSPNRIYHTMTQTLIPRPVAWVLSDNGEGEGQDRYNLAPFSYFTAVSSNPPLLMISVGKKPDGSPKDTIVNAKARKHLVIHIANKDLAAAVTESSRTREHGDSELSASQLATEAFGDFPLPRLADCKVAYACEVHKVEEIGETPQTLIFAEVKKVYIDDSVVISDDKGRMKINAQGVDAIGRLGGNEYAALGEVIDVPRPK
ncbi:flavin reductase family protein [Paraferrimonas sedimenticola]|uniref:Flavin reductase like domain-containing protein n=1 Tax=Paraferrimonas sedimenticola TaxID=375674 RepID=A0AA37RV85_9GAMM|nr:flavin reductase family protein [Paraferrimonas sedimenticola]GLP95880.1 hypothetical protein GCM10007895_11860 [Paraferrimonas sedimenticola]